MPASTSLHDDAPTPSGRGERCVLLLMMAVACWLAMQGIHEAGHMLAAVFTGGRVERVVLHPLAISRTDVEPNPYPLLVVWAGPLTGALAPLLTWLVVRRRGGPAVAWILQVFAGFCLVANGAYLATAFVGPIGDTQDLVRLRVLPAWPGAVGMALTVGGFALWHALGPSFGAARLSARSVRVLIQSLAVAIVVTAALETALSARL